ncbi:hypothetical protein QUF63_08590 [Anaerolineales bacterium HSG25]|nr:hypothetical protein [Anaerolineales bacterium HSG25]
MHIANPIYDVVFKYLMEDNEIAKLIIGTIIEEEIVELEFLPQETTVYLETLDRRSLTIYRLDFSAKIKLPEGGHKQVLIEIQKAKISTDIMRFRQYMGEQYQDKNNTYPVFDEQKQKTVQKPLPIVTIYFLGYPLENIIAPVIKVARQYYDVTTGEKIQTREEFIESLTHDSYIIQIPLLHPDHQTEVEELLMVFDQRWATADEKWVLNFTAGSYLERYDPIIRRLQSAIASPEVRRTMRAEDEILEELTMLEQEIAERDKALSEQQQALTEKDKTLSEQQQALTEKDKTLSEQQQALSEKDKVLSEQQQLIEELQRRLQSE